MYHRYNPEPSSFPWAPVLIALGLGTMAVLGVQALTKKPIVIPNPVPLPAPVPVPGPATAGSPQLAYRFQPASGLGGERDGEDALDLLL